jgi:Exopolysaccharide biosynthesis protein YbjH
MRRALVPALLLSAGAHAADPVALPSATGQTGLLAMPDARFAPDGTWRTGYSYFKPYQALWSSLTAMPWLEGSFRFTRIMYVRAFSGTPENPTYGQEYGDYRDKSFDLKLRLLPEQGWLPQVSLGAQDFFGTEIFGAYYAVASKQLGEFDFTLGYGTDRIDGAFGGVRWSPKAWRNWSLVAEYDANNYSQDLQAQQSGAAAYKKGPAAGIEYRSEWWGAKAYASHGEVGVNAWLSVPLQAKEFIPKIDEPPEYTKINPRPTEAQWADDRSHRLRLERALYEQDFRDLRVTYANGRLEAALSNTRIAAMPRAVGRAARTMLSFAPLEVREIRVTYLQGSLPFATYDFQDARLLQRYFNGMATRQTLAPTVSISYAAPQAEPSEEEDKTEALAAFEEPLPGTLLVGADAPTIFQLRSDDFLGGIGRIRPSVSGFFNDPSGAFKFDVSLLGTWDRALARHTFVNTELKLTVWENVSDVTQASNSTLPHVRTDVAQYKAGGDFKLLRALLQQYYHVAPRVYARASAGFYEEMYAGAGGQALYLSPGGSWAADLAVDALRQRDYEGWLGFLDYSTVTAIASLSYRMSQGLTATMRAGRFLAKDEGVRMEVKRRFNSGFEVGAWYTYTNGKDITSPGSPDSPYYDKGIFMQMELGALLTRDTRATASFSLAPWTRDVGQMVRSPADLARLFERQVRERHDGDGLRELGDRKDDYVLPKE